MINIKRRNKNSSEPFNIFNIYDYVKILIK